MSAPAFDWAPLFRERVGRLLKLVALKAPPFVVASEVELVFRAAWCAMPEEMGAAIAHSELTHQRFASRHCIACGAVGAEDGLCATCVAVAEAEDAAIAADEARQ